MSNILARVGMSGRRGVTGSMAIGLVLSLLSAGSLPAEELITLGMRDTPISEVMAMLSRKNRVNILLSDAVEADVSFSLYEVSLDEAIRSISNAAGYAVEQRSDTYFILPEDKAGKIPGTGFTVVRSLPIRYADAAELENKLSDYLSSYGKLTAIPEQKLIVIEDQPRHVYRITKLIEKLDQRPRQILIEAKILEVALNDEQSFGIDWEGLFSTTETDGVVGTQGLSAPGSSGSTGFFFDLLGLDYEVALRALEDDGRIRNLASPKVVTVENEEAEVIIGDRRGYRVTTTINQVSTESIEFLESGVILRVTPSVDENGQIMLDIHPEVSNGTVDENGIPSQTTTEVTTRLLVSSGQSIFIGGLMRNTTSEGRSGVPILGRIPGIRWLFSNRSRTTLNTETVVLITPRLVDEDFFDFSESADDEIERIEHEMQDRTEIIEGIIEDTFGKPADDDFSVKWSKEIEAGNPVPTPAVEQIAALEEPAPPVADSPVIDVAEEAAAEPAAIVIPVVVASEDETDDSVTELIASASAGAGAEPAADTPVAGVVLEFDPPSVAADAGSDTQLVADDVGSEAVAVTEAADTTEQSPPIDAQSVAGEIEGLPLPAAGGATKAAAVTDDTLGTVVDVPTAATGETLSAPSAESPQVQDNIARGATEKRFVVSLHSDLAPVARPTRLEEFARERVVYASEKQLDGETWYRLRLGFFATESEAQAAREALIDQFPNAWVARVGPREKEAALANAL